MRNLKDKKQQIPYIAIGTTIESSIEIPRNPWQGKSLGQNPWEIEFGMSLRYSRRFFMGFHPQRDPIVAVSKLSGAVHFAPGDLCPGH